MKDGMVLRRPPVGFALPAIEGEIQEEREEGWVPVVVTEEKTGFVVKDRRKVR